MSLKENQDLDLYSYEFDLPENLIAQYPRTERSSSRLMLLDRNNQQCVDKNFGDIVHLLPENSLLVMNSSKVFPARVKGYKANTKGAVEFLLLTPLPLLDVKIYNNNWCYANIKGLIKPAKKIKQYQWINFSEKLRLQVLQKKDFGQVNANLFWKGNLLSLLKELGSMPLPPYIKREEAQEDRERYQTVFANEDDAGSVAAPTAGLHFTEDVFSGLRERNIDFAEISLYIGYDTFTPIRTRDIRDHQMHAEYFEIPESAAEKINRAKQKKIPIVAVGTTTVRALEGAFSIKKAISPFKGWTDIFIYPGFRFQVVDHILTNFHLPKSSLLIMMSAFAGRKNMLGAYETAVKRGYRFFSYGDAMLVL
mgnify:CR=1 FL=1